MLNFFFKKFYFSFTTFIAKKLKFLTFINSKNKFIYFNNTLYNTPNIKTYIFSHYLKTIHFFINFSLSLSVTMSLSLFFFVWISSLLVWSKPTYPQGHLHKPTTPRFGHPLSAALCSGHPLYLASFLLILLRPNLTILRFSCWGEKRKWKKG